MPGGKIGGGGGHHSGGGHIGGGGFRPGSGRSGSSSHSSGSRPTGGYSGGFGGGGSFWQGMLFGSMMANQNKPSGSSQSYPQPTSYNTQGPFHQQPTFQQKPPQQQYQQAKESYKNQKPQSYGCLTALLVMIVFLVVFALMTGSCTGASGVSRSTVEREKLDAKYVTKTAYFEDTAGAVGSSAKLEKGLKAFYDETGIQPFIYFTDDFGADPSTSELDAYCESLYDELFEDQGHILVVSFGNDYDGYDYWYIVGHNAATVFDAEAEEIFADYTKHYASDFEEGEIGLDEFYSNVFSDTGTRIMQVTPNYTAYYIIALVVLVILLVLYRWWLKVKEQKNKEAAHAEAILNADINDLANDPTLSDLEGKYENYPASAAKPDAPKDEKPSDKAETYESAREQELKDPTLQELEDKYK